MCQDLAMRELHYAARLPLKIILSLSELYLDLIIIALSSRSNDYCINFVKLLHNSLMDIGHINYFVCNFTD